MSSTEVPLVSFESDGEAAVLDYNVPQTRSYPATGTTVLDIPNNWFSPKDSRDIPTKRILDDLDSEAISRRVTDALNSTTFDPILPIMGGPDPMRNRGVSTAVSNMVRHDDQSQPIRRVRTQLRNEGLDEDTINTIIDTIQPEIRGGGSGSRSITDGGTIASVASLSQSELLDHIESRDHLSTISYMTQIRSVRPADIVDQLEKGKLSMLRRTLYGEFELQFVPLPQRPQPRLCLLETYRISNYLGNYGAGRTVETFPLFPGEETTITVESHREHERQRQEASSIFDSFTRESATEFEHQVQEEMGSTTRFEVSSGTEVGMNQSVGATVPVKGIPIGAEAGVEMSSSIESSFMREDTANRVTNAVDRHATSATSKREVNVETSESTTERVGERTATERRIENINVSRTLNIVFRELNQEYVTLFHLVDVKLCYYTGDPNATQVIPLYRMDNLLEDVLDSSEEVDGTPVTTLVRRRVINELNHLFDYADNEHSFIEAVTRNDETYHRIRKDMTTQYRDEATGTTISAPGIIYGATKNTLGTGGVIVEALLGHGEGLDSYSIGLQREAVKARERENELSQEMVARSELARNIINVSDIERGTEMANRFAKVFPPIATKDRRENGDET